MAVAGILLTGGASTRMGQAKAALPAPHDPSAGEPETLARRTARLLAAVADPVVEVGPGYTGLRAVADGEPGAGPLQAIVSGFSVLSTLPGIEHLMVLATDMPYLSASFLGWLAGHPSDRSVVPVAGGRAQPLCARYCRADLLIAGDLAGAGRRALRDLLDAVNPLLVTDEAWMGAAGDARVLSDVDTPADYRALVAET